MGERMRHNLALPNTIWYIKIKLGPNSYLKKEEEDTC